jgi:hypothetical protein
MCKIIIVMCKNPTAQKMPCNSQVGRKFMNVQIIGSVEGADAEFSFAGWDGMLVLRNEDQKKIYVKKSSIRFVEEL